ncbi:FAD-binding protein [Pelagibacteraceae bacterium]|jgi:electron transfer flavoprotein alpha subunit|nr:FAD-binding protein [Pelagibacteraceae bacterium]MDA9677694.1 FAD-binding protein [Pelagibacteraceae bacterium]MDC3263288.1 FAD-binding protein [Pelagibacterales bacterium]|tara:strand:- start:7871 stop:8800 length:930 start_codon:yes stop_codon:yes gene_type:complete
MTTLFFIEHTNGQLNDQSLKAVSGAKEFGEDLHVLIAGSNIDESVTQASKIEGVSKVIHLDSSEFDNILAEKLTSAIFDMSGDYNFFASAATTTGKNVMPRLAAKLDVSQISEIVGVESADTFIRTIYAGNAIATVQSSDTKKVLTIRPTAFQASNIGDSSCEISKISPENIPTVSEFVGEELTKSDRPELTSAKTIISGGRGMQNGENFELLDKVAAKLNAAVGASRAAVDAGFVPNDYQVGQTGKVVAPELYIAVGISGAIQHLAGMKDSKIIVAINKDEEAPIFDVADYGLVADLFQVLPELESAL